MPYNCWNVGSAEKAGIVRYIILLYYYSHHCYYQIFETLLRATRITSQNPAPLLKHKHSSSSTCMEKEKLRHHGSKAFPASPAARSHCKRRACTYSKKGCTDSKSCCIFSNMVCTPIRTSFYFHNCFWPYEYFAGLLRRSIFKGPCVRWRTIHS